MDFDSGTFGESLLHYTLPVNIWNNVGKPYPTCSWSLGETNCILFLKLVFHWIWGLSKSICPCDPPEEDSRERQVNCANTCPLVDLLRWSLQLRGSIPGRLWATALAWIPCGIVGRWRPPSTIHLFNIASLMMSCCMAVLSHSVCRNTHRVSHLLHMKICVTSVRCPQRMFISQHCRSSDILWDGKDDGVISLLGTKLYITQANGIWPLSVFSGFETLKHLRTLYLMLQRSPKINFCMR